MVRTLGHQLFLDSTTVPNFPLICDTTPAQWSSVSDAVNTTVQRVLGGWTIWLV